MQKRISTIHPGEILQEEFLEPLEISQYRLAKDINVPPRRINEIVHGKRRISIDTAVRLAKYFGNSAQFWLNLQSSYEIRIKKRLAEIENIKEIKVTPGVQKKMEKISAYII